MVKRERGPESKGSSSSKTKSAKKLTPWVQEILDVAQSFDVSKDEHPAQWLVQHLKPEIIDPFVTWFNEIVDGLSLLPNDVRMPVSSSKIPFSVPLVCFHMDMPVDGWPCLADWLNTLRDIALCGFESHREATEIRPLKSELLGQRLVPLSITPAKGWGRLSCVWFCLLYTYMKLKPEGEMLADFKRFAQSATQISCVYVHLDKIEQFHFRRYQLNQQLSERQRKNPLQTIQMFNQRAEAIVKDDPDLPRGASGYKAAFHKAVEEYNSFGLAEGNVKYQIDTGTAEQLYLFKVGIDEEVWVQLTRHFHQFRVEHSAFGKDTLLCQRWLLEGTKHGVNNRWHEIMVMTRMKQQVLMKRLLFLHGIMIQRQSSKSQSVRLGVPQFLHEVDMACLIQWTYEKMKEAVDPEQNGAIMFTEECLKAALQRAYEGDFHDDFKNHLEQGDAFFEASLTQMWKEYEPQKDTDPVTICMADDEIDQADSEILQERFKTDMLKLQRDIAQIGRLQEREHGNTRAQRMHKITHLRAQNALGACEVQKFMNRQCQHIHVDSPQFNEEIVKFMNGIGPCVVWVDLMKFGTMSGKLLDNVMSTMNKFMRFRPQQTVGFMIAPFLCSDRLTNGLRDELRRLEDKLDAKSLWATLLSLRCELPPKVKKVPVQFPAFIVACDGLESWAFKNCQMLLDRGNRDLLPFAPEQSYKVPTDGKDAVPRTAEGRSLSDVQESAQLLSGKHLPTVCLSGLFTGGDMGGEMGGGTIGVVNMTPYDGFLEDVCAHWHLSEGRDGRQKVRTLSVGFDLEALAYSEKVLGMGFMEEWKTGRHCMPTAVSYNPDPPSDASHSSIDLSDFPMRVIEVKVDSLEKGFKKYKFQLPNAIRLMYHNHPLFGPDWARAIQDFDGRFGSSAVISNTMVPAEGTPEKERKEWENEPTDLDSMLSLYAVDAKFAGRTPGTTLYLTSAQRKDGVETNIQPDQSKKLFLVAHCAATIDRSGFQLAHGKSSFLKPEKLAKLKRDGGGDSMTNVVSVEWTSDEDMVVLEVFEDGGKQGRDSEPTTWKEVMEEFEENGLEYTINNHECIRQEGQASEDGHGEQADGDHGVGGYSISPKKTKVYFQYGWQQGNYKYSNVLRSSRTIDTIWRVTVSETEKEVAPRKPLYFLSKEVTLGENECLRLL